LRSLPPDGAFVLLENAAMSFDAAKAPPAVSALDSPGLTWLLLTLVGVLLVAFLAAGRWRRRDSPARDLLPFQ
jgi:hypothetical protein